eukprot:756271-Hanusia_phi.AAC.1
MLFLLLGLARPCSSGGGKLTNPGGGGGTGGRGGDGRGGGGSSWMYVLYTRCPARGGELEKFLILLLQPVSRLRLLRCLRCPGNIAISVLPLRLGLGDRQLVLGPFQLEQRDRRRDLSLLIAFAISGSDAGNTAEGGGRVGAEGKGSKEEEGAGGKEYHIC